MEGIDSEGPDSEREPRARDRISRPLAGSMRIVSEIRRVIDLLAGGCAPRDAAHTLVTVHGYSRSSANRYVAAALAMLQRDSEIEPLQSKRARIVAMALKGYEKAMARERVAASDGKFERYSDPDTRGAAMFLALLAQLEGLLPGGR